MFQSSIDADYQVNLTSAGAYACIQVLRNLLSINSQPHGMVRFLVLKKRYPYTAQPHL